MSAHSTPVVYKDIPGWPGYRAGSDGSVWSLNFSPPRRLRTSGEKSRGYSRVRIRRGGREQGVRVHRLVLLAFVGPCPPGAESCHNNGIKTDNRLENLRWDTRGANMQDRIKHGTSNAGESHGRAKLTSSQVREIRRLCSEGATQRGLARRYGVDPTTVREIVKRRNWRSVL